MRSGSVAVNAAAFRHAGGVPPRRALAFSTILRLGAVLVLLAALLVVGRPEPVQAQALSPTALPGKGFDLDTALWQPASIWSDGETMWVASAFHGGEVKAYRMSDGAHQASSDFALDADNTHPVGVWSDGEFMWVVDNLDRKVYVYDLDTKDRVASREFDLHSNHDGFWVINDSQDMALGAWSDGETIWIIDAVDLKLYAYDLTTGARQTGKEFALVGASRHHTRDIWSDGTTVWVSDSDDGKLYAYDLDGGTRQTSKDIHLPSDNNKPTGVWSDGETMWVAQSGFRMFSVGVVGDKVFAYDVSSLTTNPDDTTSPDDTTDDSTGSDDTTGSDDSGTPEPAASFVIYHDPGAGARAVGRYNQAVALLKAAGISYSEVTGDVRAEAGRLAGVGNSVMPRFFLGDPTASDWTSQPKVNNGGLRWLKKKAAELSGSS